VVEPRLRLTQLVSMPTWKGTFRGVKSPTPSCPNEFAPQQKIAPLALRAHVEAFPGRDLDPIGVVWADPAATRVQFEAAPAWTGAGWLREMPFPRRPLVDLESLYAARATAVKPGLAERPAQVRKVARPPCHGGCKVNE
jgi:hypothetical protein